MKCQCVTANLRERKVTNEEEGNYLDEGSANVYTYAFNSKNLSRQHAKLRLLSDLYEPSLIKNESLLVDDW